jgi:hypothetical protein
MTRDYHGVMNAAVDLEQFRGFLTVEEEKQQREATGRFNSARNRFVYDALRGGEEPEAVKRGVEAEIGAMIAADDYRAATYHFVRDELFARIDREAGKRPWVRSMWRWSPTALGVLLACIYFGVRLASGVTIDQPETSKQGLIQRAAAFEKAATYNEWINTDTRRGGWLKGLLLWPIEPSEAEIKGAREFASLALEGYDVLSERGEICGTLAAGPSDQLSAEQIAFTSDIAEHIQRDGTAWQAPPVMTILQPIRTKYPC